MATHVDSQDYVTRSSRSPRRWLPPAVFAAVVALALLGEWLRAPALLKALLAAPIYYGLPLGVGLLVTRHLESTLTRTQQALLAYFCGLVLICVVMVAREHAVPTKLDIHWFSSLILLAALAGLAAGHKLFAWNSAARNAARDYLVVVPIFAIEYALRFGVFSDFPVTDLFQATHLMKGALEFGRFDVLNPFTADSYVPVIQVMEGLMVRYFGFVPLMGAWVLPAFATILKFLACRAAFQALLHTPEARLFATLVAASFFAATTPTNGNLAALGSLLAFSLAVCGAADGRFASAARVLAVGLAGFAIGYAATRSLPAVYVAVIGGVCLLPFAARLVRMDWSVLPIGLLVVSLMPIHRSTLAFFPLALLLGTSMPLLTAWVRAGGDARIKRTAAGVLTLTALAAAGTFGLLVWILADPSADLQETGPGEWVIEAIIGTTFADVNVSAGGGPKVALFELARLVVPSVVIFTGILVACAFTQDTFKRHPDRAAFAMSQAFVAWGLAVALGGALLTGVPFVYRSGFLIVTLLAVAIVAASQVLEEINARMPYRVVALLVCVYLTLVIPVLYRCGAIIHCERSDYLDMARPFLTVFGLLILAGAILGVLSPRIPAGRRYVVPIVLILLFSLERNVSRAYFMPYSYGMVGPTESEAVSHISKEEIDLAALLKGMGEHIVIVSDPYTMANIGALTGLNSLVTYANLDTLSNASRTRLRNWLTKVIEPEEARSTCAARHPLEAVDHSVNSAEFNYWLVRSARPQITGAEVLRLFGLRNTFFTTVHPSRKGMPDHYLDHEWRKSATEELEVGASSSPFPGEPAIVLVVNRKTVRWARDDGVSYFPDVRPLERAIVERMVNCGATIYTDRFALIRFPMARR
jgi:hypothetical protein